MELFYNPERMSETEIKETFVAHQWLVDEIISILKRQPKGAGVQHVVIVAPRGMGKTTLLLMLRFTVISQDIAQRWQPVLFPEESYSIYDLSDLWMEVLDHIASETGDLALHEEVQKLKTTHPDSAELEGLTLARIKDWRAKNKKRLMLLVDNFDMILEQIGDEKDNASLRDVLMNDGTMMLIGGSTTFFKEARAYEQPLYNLFKIYNLNGLDSDQIEDLLRRRAKIDGVENFEEILRANRTRLRVLEYFTGGNPRLVLMLYRVITQSQIGEVRRGLEKLLDEVTPYYKAKIETLPPQQRKILDQIARISAQTREGLTPTEIASATRLAVNQVSAQLKRLADDGYVRAANIRGRSSYYTLSEPLYAIWHQMRFGRDARMKMNWLVSFLKGWYDARELSAECQRLQVVFRKYLKAGREKDARDALEHRRYLMEAIEDQQSRVRTFESIVLSYLELSDTDTLRRELLTGRDAAFISQNVRQKLIAIGLLREDHRTKTPAHADLTTAIELLQTAVKAGRIKEVVEAFTEFEKGLPADSAGVFFVRAFNAMLERDIDRCLSNVETALQESPDMAIAWHLKGTALLLKSQFGEASEAFERSIKLDPTFKNWYLLAITLAILGRHEEAVPAFDKALELQPQSFDVFYRLSRSLAELSRTDEALSNLDKALSLKPDYAEGWYQRGELLAAKGVLEQALQSVDHAIELKPDSYDFLFGKAWYLGEMGKREEALRLTDQLLDLEATSSDSYFLRGLLLISTDFDNGSMNIQRAFDSQLSSRRGFVHSTGAALFKFYLSTLHGNPDQIRIDWAECIRLCRNEWADDTWVEVASDALKFIALNGYRSLARELIVNSELEQPLFPLTRALDYLSQGDEGLVEKLSPEVRRIVDEIVDALKKTSSNTRKTPKKIEVKLSRQPGQKQFEVTLEVILRLS